MKFTPKTEQEIASESLLPIGWYDFEVLDAKPKISKAAQLRGEKDPNMIELKLRVYETADRGVFVTDYLMEAMAFKLRHFCAETNLMEAYSNGHLTADMCVGKTGRCKIGPSKPKGDFLPKDEVKDYGEKGSTESAPSAATTKVAPTTEENTDDVPW